jgi:heat shock protein HspQ
MAYDISLTQGENYSLTARLKNTDGSYMNLSGYYVRGKARYSYGYTGVVVDLDPQIYSVTGGIIEVELTSSQTSSLPVGFLVYDIEKYTSGDANVSKVLNGKIIVCPEVTY